jgi:hypothetical protein
MTQLINSRLKKWRARIMETLSGSDQTTAVSGPRYGVQRCWRLIAGVLALALMTSGAVNAAEHDSNALMLQSLRLPGMRAMPWSLSLPRQ